MKWFSLSKNKKLSRNGNQFEAVNPVLSRQAGFTLIEIMIAVGIMSGLTLVLAEVLTTMKKNTKRAELRESIDQDHLDFETLLMNRVACTRTFGVLGSLATATPTTRITVPNIINGLATPGVVITPGLLTGVFPRPPAPASAAQYSLLSVEVTGFNVVPNSFDVNFRYQMVNPEIRPRDLIKQIRFQANFSVGNVVISCNNSKSSDYDVLYVNVNPTNPLADPVETKNSNLDVRGRLHVGPGPAAYANAGVVVARNFFTNSDERKKENIKSLKSSLRLITKLNGVEFDWLQSQEHDWGVIAQQVKKVIPGLVTDFGNSSGLTVNYNGLIAISIESLKELKGEKERLDAEVLELEKVMKDVESEFCKEGSVCYDSK